MTRVKPKRTIRDSIRHIYPDMLAYGISRYGRERGEDCVHDAAVVLLETRMRYMTPDTLRAVWVAIMHKAYFRNQHLADDDITQSDTDLAQYAVELSPRQHAQQLFLDSLGCLEPVESRIIFDRHFLGHDWEHSARHHELTRKECEAIYQRALRKMQILFNVVEQKG